MKGRRTLLVGLLGALFFLRVDLARAGEETKPQASKSEKKAEMQAERMVYKFKNSQELAEFQRMYQQLQFVNTRIAVLEGYLVQERANLEQLNAQMYLKFKFSLELDKQYNLDMTNMIITEIPPLQEVQPPP